MMEIEDADNRELANVDYSYGDKVTKVFTFLPQSPLTGTAYLDLSNHVSCYVKTFKTKMSNVGIKVD